MGWFKHHWLFGPALLISLFLLSCSSSVSTDRDDPDTKIGENVTNTDADGDGVLNDEDNCPTLANEDQEDSDGNGVGDVCEELSCTPGFCQDGNFLSDYHCDGGASVLCGIDEAGCLEEKFRRDCDLGCDTETNPGFCAIPPPNPNDPVIESFSGTLADGEAITISGRDLGKNLGDIEWMGGAQSDGGKIESLNLNTKADSWGPGWRIGISSGVTPAHISNGRAHTYQKSIKSWVNDTDGSWNSGFAFEPGHDGNTAKTPFKEIYASWWMYFNPISDYGNCGEGSPQWKMWRLNATESYSSSNQNYLGEIMSSGNWSIDSSSRTNLYTMNWAGYVPDYNCNTHPDTCYSWGYPDANYDARYHSSPPNDGGKWVRWEIYVKASSAPEVKDAVYIYRIQVPGERTWSLEWETDFGTHRSLPDYPGVSAWNTYTRFVWQNYWGNCGKEAEWFTDDIYMQVGSRARIEIGDAPIFEDCTQREVQKPIDWSEAGDSVQFKLNIDGFKTNPNSGRYLFVVREDGRVSNGIKLELE